MITEGAYLESLIREYEEIIEQRAQPEDIRADANLRLVSDALYRCSDWTERGAAEIARLARDYGAFILRNALAIAIVLEREDGKLSF